MKRVKFKLNQEVVYMDANEVHPQWQVGRVYRIEHIEYLSEVLSFTQERSVREEVKYYDMRHRPMYPIMTKKEWVKKYKNNIKDIINDINKMEAAKA